MATPGPINPDAVIAQVKRLINAQLKAVLKQCNLPVSGAKAALQQRIITRMCCTPILIRLYFKPACCHLSNTFEKRSDIPC